MDRKRNWFQKIMDDMFKFIYGDKQTTFIYCKCGNDLCGASLASTSFISDTYAKDRQNEVKYKCTKCGKVSYYNFDIAPAPINWEDIDPERFK